MDGISSDYDLIYKNPFHYTLNIGKLLSFTTVPASIAVQLSYYWTGTLPITETLHNTQVFFNYADAAPIMMSAFIVMNLLVTAVCHASTLRIYKKDDK